ncbi:hypothetical protein EPUS_02053 [Endocarpon pusillum Z07020]|uniref:Queuosine 5'-phosphate N-glycosylase/hydrolase n=1 Tax=Endocarpon pusillum (strain Z07020 / HMAS-L-300199) TaxID=1263415 RepID=U1GQW3_ENDPU|nr:uncharacterized protein EPUS_02053 [Endocarpon pusillum Z07020]ERF74366.1 hypothetical protein EPUS_02053 [Endocarpon pusillum Z07020]
MSDDEDTDASLLALLRQSLSLTENTATPAIPETGVLSSAKFIYNNSIDVAIDSSSTKLAATNIYNLMQSKQYSTHSWSAHDLHPKAKDKATLDFIFTMDLLNFSFWSESSEEQRFAVEYRGKRWTGYWSLVACLQRAIDQDVPITDSHFWQDEGECTLELLQHLFRSTTSEQIPMLRERLDCLREAGTVLYKTYSCSFANCIAAAKQSAAALVSLLVQDFPCLRDEHQFEGRRVRIYKRAQILVADIWACFNGESYGTFHDIDSITMFADYRIPQMLHSLGCLMFSPPLEGRIRRQEEIKSGERYEVELRGCSIWVVELIRRQIMNDHPDAKVNSILIDNFLYDTLKEKEAAGEMTDMIPHHRTRSIWY